jgi:hypothetical protein
MDGYIPWSTIKEGTPIVRLGAVQIRGLQSFKLRLQPFTNGPPEKSIVLAFQDKLLPYIELYSLSPLIITGKLAKLTDIFFFYNSEYSESNVFVEQEEK